AEENRVFLVGGSVPEKGDDGRLYNTSYVFDDMGRQVAKHRKVHLFDIDVEGQYFKESDTLAPGNRATVFEAPFGRVGVMICYDLRFPELARLLVKRGAVIFAVPAAFNMTTGPAHWELLFRCRALDNQVFALGAAPARNTGAAYVSYANSIITDPWGRVVARLGEDEGVLVEEIDLGEVERIRSSLPLLKHVRSDVYELRERHS
ncbi:MAG: carbon-nitrogen hydrolase family protein, partial [Thermacetogeniaceae bacterium]